MIGESDNIDSGPGQGLVQTRLEQQNQTPSDRDKARRSIVFPEYSNSPYTCSPSVGGTPTTLAAHPIPTPSAIISSSRPNEELDEEDRLKLFGDIPESKKRKFILVDDPGKSGRVRVRVTLDTVNINEIPDSFRKNNSVYPRSWFPLQMQSLPPSANGGHIFEDEDEDDLVEVTARETRNSKGKMRTSVTLSDGAEGEIGVPRIRKSMRRKEIRLNDLGYRMTWHQSRVFADKTVFLQKACEFNMHLSIAFKIFPMSNSRSWLIKIVVDSYRNKIRTTMESIGKDVSSTAPHFETRVGKRRWCERNKRERRSPDET